VPPNSGADQQLRQCGERDQPGHVPGGRAELLYQINDDWKALITQSYQDLDAEGVFWAEQYDGLGHRCPTLPSSSSARAYNKGQVRETPRGRSMAVSRRCGWSMPVRT